MVFEIKDAGKFLRRWYIPAIKDLLTIYNFDGSDYNELAQLFIPKITVDEAEHAISELEKASIIEKRDDGIYHVIHENVRVADTQENIPFIRAYQKKLSDIAKIHFCKKDDPFIYKDTRDLTEDDFDNVKKLNEKYRKKLHKIAKEDKNENSLYQVYFSVTPPQDKISNFFDLINYSIDNVEKDERDISTLTLSLSNDGLTDTKELLKDYKKKVEDIPFHGKTYGVVCCMYPLTKEIKKKITNP